jgi:hypothetical protein
MLVQSTLRSRLPGVFITGELRLADVFTTGELRLAGVFTTGESFWTPGSHFTDVKEHITIFKGSVILKIDCRLLYLLGNMRFMFAKIA